MQEPLVCLMIFNPCLFFYFVRIFQRNTILLLETKNKFHQIKSEKKERKSQKKHTLEKSQNEFS